MMITNEYGSIDFDLGSSQNILIHVSGGADSALLLFLTMKFVSEGVTIRPYWNNRPGKGTWRKSHHDTLISLIKKRFPNTPIEDVHMTEIGKQDHSEEIPHPIVKFAYHTIGEYKKLNCDLMMIGRSSNIPEEILSRHPRTHIVERRDEPFPTRGNRYPISEGLDSYHDIDWYMPLSNIDKRFVAQCYRDYDLMEDIFPWTVSCSTPRADLNDALCCGREYCQECCERKFAFGTF